MFTLFLNSYHLFIVTLVRELRIQGVTIVLAEDEEIKNNEVKRIKNKE